ncbi:MAG: hypothetical protein ABI277_07060 [Burkholderiaceae bacterium]
MPELQLLSNGSYHVMVTASGHGYSRWKDMAITRWRDDATLDDGGTRCYLRAHLAESIGPTRRRRSNLPPRPADTTSNTGARSSGAAIWVSRRARRSRSRPTFRWSCDTSLSRIIAKSAAS